jgi:hypothetical protein
LRKTIMAALAALLLSGTAQAEKSGRYSPAIERAYAGRYVVGLVDKTCQVW